MSTEIKVQYTEIAQKLANLQSKAKSLKTSFPTDIGGKNHMDVISRLNEIGADVQKILHSYQSFLLKSENATKEAIKSMKELDERVSGQFQPMK
ncbi:hypothetical protein B5V88_12720 [Heyndrickxia sporothermodurans]|uniref:YwqI/YxiC family protein n=1 Tax=Heyndrickxia sporothermodurans TaxID=46224 RepID=A0AB37HJF3_9BACI|nr:YwqI/YxiC family protein [Heyndrickxia sporothermodurans]MBL5783054.1 YwqI/YxiC family protein [Heyndrickxia sporothermodurans]MBL5794205.1 YwqI/YxiC family protein [Heyndrickxia sporothermodurans]MBL5855188.1 YwqI/YxiC family protein [Heyndrickxia sporothermodurans]MBL5867268.1 YwqI/YxiC family protein [Heyndrickxia sporothermodurans]MBL7248262.1 YwqI/YxiC family protein [Heyndrickxia sporothermodurans]